MTPALKKCPAVGNRQKNSRHEKIFKKSDSERERCKMREREKISYFPRNNGQLLNWKPENIRMVFQCIEIREVSTDNLISNKKVFYE